MWQKVITIPDISNLLAAKAQRRLALAALSWEAKVTIVERMQQLLPKDAWKSRPAHRASEQGASPGLAAADEQPLRVSG